MVRLVFRPYAQVWRTICTSVPLRTSIRVSPDFILLRHSSPSFGSRHACCAQRHSKRRMPVLLSEEMERSLSLRMLVCHQNTRTHVRLLGPCSKTGLFRPCESSPWRQPGLAQGRRSFYLCNFRHYLTLFTKFFSTFPHGTCSLSVSHTYLAFDGDYHRVHATISRSTTREGSACDLCQGFDGAVTLNGVEFQGTFCPSADRRPSQATTDGDS